MIEVSLYGNKVGVLDPEVKMNYNYFDSMFANDMP